MNTDNKVKKNNQNLWVNFPHDTYVKHMGHENVRQIEMLSRISKGQFSLVAAVSAPVIAILGITDGNGLCNVQKGYCKAIIGMDINEEYLNVCRERFGNIPELELYRIDLMTEKDHAAEILKSADLVTANLLIEHIHLDNFINIVSQLMKPIISVTIQFNPDNQFVSHSGYEAAFNEIQKHGQECGESSLTTAMCGDGYKMTGRTEYILPNGKVFIRLDYRRSITIRLAVPSDAPDMAEVLMRSWETAYKDIIPSDFIREKNATRPSQFNRIITDENANSYVIQYEGKTIGIMSIAASQDDDIDGGCYELQNIYLHPDHFQQGIGTHALTFAFNKARGINKTSMIVWVFADNSNSIQFYEKCGFIPDGKTKTLDYGKAMKCIRMRRAL